MKLASLVLISALAAAALAQAQTPAPGSEPGPATAPVPNAPNARKACRADAMKLCSGKRGQEALACLRANSDKISPDCKDAIANLPPPPSS